MKLREAILQVKGFRYMTEQLDISSALGRRFLHEMDWFVSGELLETELSKVEALCGVMATVEGKSICGEVVGRLRQMRDIRGTVKRMGENCVLDDLELFELKYFALLSEEIRERVTGWEFVRIPEVSEVIRLLDPEGERIPHFYICDAYSESLAAIRKRIKARKQQGDEQGAEELYAQSLLLEDEVRAELSEQLRGFQPMLQQALQQVAWLDVALAKACQAKEMRLVRPGIGRTGAMVLKGVRNPLVENALRETGKKFQPVDICLETRATVITGANMAGKTVLLKTVALAQYLTQFGFFVPAVEAEMILVDEVLISIDDEQDELKGLSSYAAEMVRINGIVSQVKAGRKILVLIDELARTTNPEEGKAIVNGVVEFLTDYKTMALVTTHYSGITAPCRKLRVRGFVENHVVERLTPANMNDFIDYSLLEDSQDEVPHEAVRIARILGVDDELIGKIKRYGKG